MITNTQSGTNIQEVADGIFRINTPVSIPGAGQFSFNQYLIVDDAPMLFHTGQRQLFPVVSEAIRAVKTSRFADGTPFDAPRTAVVDSAHVPPTLHFSPGASAVSVTRIGDGDIGLRVTSQGGGFLVLSENAYPGWRALIDGSEVPIYRTDVTLQGVVVPAGTHRVDFILAARSLRWGLITSGISAMVCASLLLWVDRRARNDPPATRSRYERSV